MQIAVQPKWVVIWDFATRFLSTPEAIMAGQRFQNGSIEYKAIGLCQSHWNS